MNRAPIMASAVFSVVARIAVFPSLANPADAELDPAFEPPQSITAPVHIALTDGLNPRLLEAVVRGRFLGIERPSAHDRFREPIFPSEKFRLLLTPLDLMSDTEYAAWQRSRPHVASDPTAKSPRDGARFQFNIGYKF